MVCFEIAGARSGVQLDVDFVGAPEAVDVHWVGEVSDKMRLGYLDAKKRVDFGACAIALLLVPEFTRLTAVEQSATGNGIDYFLADATIDDHLIFNRAAALEVSGIQQASQSNTISKRIAEKKKRLRDTRNSPTATGADLPAYICVVDFGHGQARVVLV
jgi:hypothetical protein